MRKTLRISLGIASAAFLFQACSSQPTKSDGPMPLPTQEAAKEVPSLDARKGPVWIVKSDGAILSFGAPYYGGANY